MRQARERGESAFYGDATRDEILRALGVEQARMLVAAISDPAATRRMVRTARGLNPKLHIIARTRYVVEIPELVRLGADDVIPEEFETSIEIFARVLSHYGAPRTDVDRLVDQIRASHYEALRGGPYPTLGAVAGAPQILMERIRLPADSALVGKAIAQSGMRTKTGALILSVRRGDAEFATPDPSFRLAGDDVLLLIGQPEQLQAATALLKMR